MKIQSTIQNFNDERDKKFPSTPYRIIHRKSGLRSEERYPSEINGRGQVKYTKGFIKPKRKGKGPLLAWLCMRETEREQRGHRGGGGG